MTLPSPTACSRDVKARVVFSPMVSFLICVDLYTHESESQSLYGGGFRQYICFSELCLHVFVCVYVGFLLIVWLPPAVQRNASCLIRYSKLPLAVNVRVVVSQPCAELLNCPGCVPATYPVTAGIDSCPLVHWRAW